ncbi:MAG: Abortive infection protein [Acidobacteria bacterium]|nr:Abortive infection protein [Acidobacteriota bacterium]
MRTRLDGRDWTFLLVCGAVAAASLLVILRYFASAFPEASIEFRYDRGSSRPIAERVLAAQHIDVRSLKHTAVFDADNNAKIFLERSLGLERANAVMRRDVHLWYWHHRWFRPLQEEEYAADVAPTGELVSYARRLPEGQALPSVDAVEARGIAERFLAENGIDVRPLQLVAQSERRLPRRMQRIFTWESRTVRPAGAPYRYEIVVDGNAIGSYAQRLRVPEQWQREYAELRSKNFAASNADLIFLGATIIAALVVFVVRLRRGDLPVRMLLAIGGVTFVLVALNSLNSYPSAVAGYSTTSSFAAFLTQFIVGALISSLGAAMFLMVLAGAGEVLYRERLPQHLALPKLWTPRALASKRVFRSFVLGYTLVAFFIAYQVAFYLIAARFGAWAPAELPYDDILNSALPWVAVLFAGWFPALSEELMSRAFSIPFVERLLRSRIAAIVISGFVWGFGHAAYPNQPFFIRGLEVGLAGCALGFLFYRFGLLPLLIWHYTVDALYTALLLFRSHNGYYIFSGALASLVFAIPMLISIGSYIRHRGFLPDDDLSNATLPLSEPPPPREIVREAIPLPPPIEPTGARLVACIVAVAIAAGLMTTRGPSPADAIDYRITAAEAKAVATRHLTQTLHQPLPRRVIATPLEGFRNWDRNSGREDGGGPGGFDQAAADHLLHRGVSVRQLIDIFRNRVQAGTWTVRFFTPRQKVEDFVEVDPRTSHPIGYHKYQDENAPGPRLEEPQALAIARSAFAVYGLDLEQFELKEALAFQQPNRRDWLFHFQERKPLADEAYRRVTVRVSGDEVTQFTTTVKVPDAVYREADRQTFLNVALIVVKIAGSVAVLALIVTGLVIVLRHGHAHWKRAARWTLAFAPVPIVTTLASYESRLFGYSTSMQWQTFLFDLAVDTIRSVGLQLGVFFLAIAALDAAYPHARSLLRRESRARFGRSAAIAALTAIAVFAASRTLVQMFTSLFPSIASVGSIDAPNDVAVFLPGILTILQAAFAAVVLSAAMALFAVALRSLPHPRWGASLVTILSLAAVTVSPNVPPHAMPLMLFRALLLGVVIWLIVRYVTAGNLLAYPLAIFTVTIASNAATLLQNHRPDLIANAVAELLVLGLVMLWIVRPRSARA